MSDSTPTGNDDIIEGNATAFVVGVPNASQSEFVDYLRLGEASNSDEGYLQEDPAATGSNPLLISNAGTTSPFSNGPLTYTTGTMQLVAPYSYIRLGTTTPYETWLPTSTKDTDGVIQPSNDGSFLPKGIVVYSTDTLQMFASSINQTTSQFSQWQDDSLSVVMNGSAVMATNRTMGSSGWTSTFQRAEQLNTTLGSVTNAITGQSITQWLGNDCSTGLGGLLWSNFGHTQNVFGGTIVNLINDGIDVQGWGEVKIGGDVSTVATSNITLAVNPVAATTRLGAGSIAAKVGIVAGLIATAAEVAMDIVSDVTVTEAEKVSGQTANNMRVATDVAFGAIAAASGAVLIVQAMTIAMGIIASATGKTAGLVPPAGIIINQAGVLIKGGGTELMITAAGVQTTAPTYDVNAGAIGFAL